MYLLVKEERYLDAQLACQGRGGHAEACPGPRPRQRTAAGRLHHLSRPGPRLHRHQRPGEEARSISRTAGPCRHQPVALAGSFSYGRRRCVGQALSGGWEQRGLSPHHALPLRVRQGAHVRALRGPSSPGPERKASVSGYYS